MAAMRSALRFFVAILWLAVPIASAQEQKPDDLPVEQLTWGEFEITDKRSPFKTWLHDTDPERLATACSWQLAAAQWTQDLVAARKSEAHFDNCAFEEAVAFIEDRLQAADKAVAKSQHGAAMFALGQALHALQDFYSHSSYIELMVAASPKDMSLAQPIAFWSTDGRSRLEKLIGKGLTSGTVSYSESATKRCADGAPSHETLAKDSARFSAHAAAVIPGWKNRTYHVAAVDLADAATRQFLTYAFRRWPSLGKSCGKPVGYLTLVERRDAP